jgi:hypothetical protein
LFSSYSSDFLGLLDSKPFPFFHIQGLHLSL